MMPSPTSPRTPTRRRHRVSLESLTTSSLPPYQYHDSSPGFVSRSRQSSLHSPTTPRTPNHRRSSQGLIMPSSARMSVDLAGSMTAAAGNGLGSLADELADAWDEDGEGDEGLDETGPESQHDGCDDPSYYHAREGSIDLSPSSAKRRLELEMVPTRPADRMSKHPKKSSERQKWARDGDDDMMMMLSEDGPNEISSALEARLAEVETLARRGLGLGLGEGHDDDQVIERTIEGLKDLGGQASVESGTTRLINAHNALTSHLTQQTRALQSLTYPLLSPFSLPPDPSIIADLLPLLTTDLIPPRPILTSTTAAAHNNNHISLNHISHLTTDLIHTLTQLSDTLHMSRQTTQLAARRLKSALALASDMHRDADSVHAAIRWIEDGDWPARLARRDCHRVCRDVLAGFEDVCRGWRERIFSADGGGGGVGGGGGGASGMELESR